MRETVRIRPRHAAAQFKHEARNMHTTNSEDIFFLPPTIKQAKWQASYNPNINPSKILIPRGSQYGLGQQTDMTSQWYK